MKVNLSFVPPGGGETEYSLEFDLPSVPQRGDYISVFRPGQAGAETFVVKRTWWSLEFDDEHTRGSLNNVWVECEFALSYAASEEHRRYCEGFKRRDLPLHAASALR